MPTAKNVKPSAAKASKGKQSSQAIPKARGRPAGVVGPKKKTLFQGDEKLGIYLRKILIQVHPEIGISKDAMSTINSLVLDIYRKIGSSAAEVSRKGKTQSLTA